MWRNYFELNGKKYYTGTVMIVHYTGRKVEASFVCYDVDYEQYVCMIGNCRLRCYEKHFYDMIISITNKIDPNINLPEVKQKRDCSIDGLFLGWVWYIFLMAISFIFKEAIGLWIFISIVFFSWRSAKIKKEGTYVEW